MMRAYREDLSSCDFIRLPEVWERIANMPSSRFWVTEERAAVVIRKMMRGDKLKNMRPLKKEMFDEIYRQVRMLMATEPNMSLYECCVRVVNSPAPKFYMTPLSIRQTIYKIKRKWYEERKRKYRHLF